MWKVKEYKNGEKVICPINDKPCCACCAWYYCKNKECSFLRNLSSIAFAIGEVESVISLQTKFTNEVLRTIWTEIPTHEMVEDLFTQQNEILAEIAKAIIK